MWSLWPLHNFICQVICSTGSHRSPTYFKARRSDLLRKHTQASRGRCGHHLALHASYLLWLVPQVSGNPELFSSVLDMHGIISGFLGFADSVGSSTDRLSQTALKYHAGTFEAYDKGLYKENGTITWLTSEPLLEVERLALTL